MKTQNKPLAQGLSLLLALLLTLGVFAGCANGTASSDAEVTSSSQRENDTSSEAGTAVKTITFEVVHKDGSKKEFEITTEAENLRKALEQENLISGEEGEYGLFVQTVDGETVDQEKEEWWCLTKGGEAWNYGVDSTEIADGDAFEFTFTVGW